MKTRLSFSKQIFKHGLIRSHWLQVVLLFLVFAHLIPPTFAQTKEWDKTIGGKKDDHFTTMVSTPDGGYLLGGTSLSEAGENKTQNRKVYSDFWVVKVDATGKKLWDKTLGGKAGYNNLKAIINTPEGGFLLGGESTANKSGDKSENTKGDFDYWVVNLDARGNKMWDKTLGGPYADNLNALITTPDGGYLLGGYSDSARGSDKSETGKGSADYWVVKINKNGTKIWDKTFGGSSFDVLSALVATSDGGYLLGGYSDSGIEFDKSEGSRGDSDYWVVKINAAGIKEWDKTFGAGKSDYLFDLVATPDGGYLLGGTSDSEEVEGDKSEEGRGWEDYWLVKINGNGTKVWDRTLGGRWYDVLQSLIITPDGGFLVGGYSASYPSSEKSEIERGFEDYWVIKLNSTGVKIWDKTIGADSADVLRKVINTLDGNYLLGGFSHSSSGNDKTEPNKGEIEDSYGRAYTADYWVVKLKDAGLPANPYCVPVITQGCRSDIYIRSFSFYTLFTNASGCNQEENNYFNHSPAGARTTTVKRGHHYSFTLQAGPDQPQSFGIWIDYNNDLDFEDAGEFIYHSGTAITGTIAGTITVPVDASPGRRRLRVRTKSAGTFARYDACTATKYGETEDYTITIDPKPANNQWNRRYGGAGDESLTSIIKTSDGGYLGGGHSPSGSNEEKTQPGQGKNDFWIIKTDATGNKIWDKTYGGSGHDYLNRIIQTQDGGYLLAGSSLSGISGHKTQASRGGRDYWIVKISSTGVKQWDKRYGGTGSDELKKALQLSTGEYILAGYSNSPASGDKSQSSQGGNDYWVIKLSREGNKIWDKRYGGSLNETLGGIVRTSNEGFLLGGHSASGLSGDKSELSRGGTDFWLLRLDQNGNKLWDKTYGGSGEDEAYSLGRSGRDDFFISGQSDSPAGADKTENRQGGRDFWFIKIKGSGAKIWDKRLGGSHHEELRASIQMSDGGYLLAGKTRSGNGNGNVTQRDTVQGNNDYWIVKTDAEGNYLWDKRFNGYGENEIRAVIQTNDGGLLLAGKTNAGLREDKTQPSQGGYDFWLVKVAPETMPLVATREETELVEEPLLSSEPVNLKASPNPFSEQVTVSFTLSATQQTQLKVYDSQGREVAILFQGEAKANQAYQVEWKAGSKANGMYLLQLQTPTKHQQQKLLLAR